MKRLSVFVSGLALSLGLSITAYAQQSCEGIFQSYNKAEIVDVLVNVRDTWMSIAKVPQKIEMLGKADDIYITPATVCRDLTLIGVNPALLAEGLNKKRSAREEAARWLGAYRQQMLDTRAEAPASSSKNASSEPVETVKVAANEQETRSTLPMYDVKAHCRKVADTVGGSYQIEKTCREQEQEAQKALTTLVIPSRIAHHCQKVGATVGGSYQIMLTCVEQEIEAKNQL